MTTADIISIVSVFIAIVSTIVAVVAITSGHKINNKEILLQYYEDLKDWFEEVVHIMKELYVKYPAKTNKEELKNSLVRLGTYIDLGRIFFKNQISGDYKINRPEVFRGRRVILLDVVVLYYKIFDRQLQEENRDILWGLQRAFISEMIMLLDKNKFSDRFIEYDFVDENDIIEIENIKNEQFREILLKEDIIKAVKEKTIKIENPTKRKKKTNK